MKRRGVEWWQNIEGISYWHKTGLAVSLSMLFRLLEQYSLEIGLFRIDATSEHMTSVRDQVGDFGTELSQP